MVCVCVCLCDHSVQLNDGGLETSSWRNVGLEHPKTPMDNLYTSTPDNSFGIKEEEELSLSLSLIYTHAMYIIRPLPAFNIVQYATL